MFLYLNADATPPGLMLFNQWPLAAAAAFSAAASRRRLFLRGDDAFSGAVPAGTYLLKASCRERASGAVPVEVLPAN